MSSYSWAQWALSGKKTLKVGVPAAVSHFSTLPALSVSSPLHSFLQHSCSNFPKVVCVCICLAVVVNCELNGVPGGGTAWFNDLPVISYTQLHFLLKKWGHKISAAQMSSSSVAKWTMIVLLHSPRPPLNSLLFKHRFPEITNWWSVGHDDSPRLDTC